MDLGGTQCKIQQQSLLLMLHTELKAYRNIPLSQVLLARPS